MEGLERIGDFIKNAALFVQAHGFKIVVIALVLLFLKERFGHTLAAALPVRPSRVHAHDYQEQMRATRVRQQQQHQEAAARAKEELQKASEKAETLAREKPAHDDAPSCTFQPRRLRQQSEHLPLSGGGGLGSMRFRSSRPRPGRAGG